MEQPHRSKAIRGTFEHSQVRSQPPSNPKSKLVAIVPCETYKFVWDFPPDVLSSDVRQGHLKLQGMIKNRSASGSDRDSGM